jgi:recombination protein RecA
MAKKAKAKTVDENLKPEDRFDAIRKSIEKKYGEGTALCASEVKLKKKFLVPVSPALDIGLCGGIPSGSWVLISGPEKAGKSTLALQIAKNAEELYGCETLFLNVESRFKRQSTTSVEGINLNKILVVETTADKLLYGEDYLSIAEDVIKTTKNSVIIFDSLSRMYTAAAGDKEVSGQRRPSAPKLISDFVSRMGGMVAARNHIIICIAQEYANVGVNNGPSKTVAVPNCVKYQSDVIMNIKWAQAWKKNIGKDSEEQIGNIINWDIVHNAIGQPPFGLIQSYLRFGVGVGRIEELFNIAVECELIQKNISWFEFGDGTKVQGEDKACQHLIDNPQLLEELNETIKDFTQDKEILATFLTPGQLREEDA